jgi:cytochrome c oxidase subunit II
VKVPSTITALVCGILLTLVSLWVGQNNHLLPTVASEEALKIDGLFNAMLSISVGLFVLVQGAIVYSVFKFRYKPGDETDAEPIEGNIPLEILWTAVPTIIVMWLAVYSFDVYKAVDGGNAIGAHHMAHAHTTTQIAAQPGTAAAATLSNNSNLFAQAAPVTAPAVMGSGMEKPPEKPLIVNVNGLQYAWIFTYPETGIVSGQLNLPLGRPVILNITASDVIHAFWVPEFRLKQDAVPGQENHLNFVPSLAGTYPLICAELCGAYHGGMKTQVIVQAPEAYQAWEQSQKAVASKDPTILAAAMHDTAMQSQVEAMGFGVSPAAMEHLHHQHVATTATLPISPAL